MKRKEDRFQRWEVKIRQMKFYFHRNVQQMLVLKTLCFCLKQKHMN